MFIGALFGSFCLASLTALALQSTGVPAFKSPDSFPNVLLGTLSLQGMTWVLMFIFLKMHAVDWRDAFGLRPHRVINVDAAIVRYEDVEPRRTFDRQQRKTAIGSS